MSPDNKIPMGLLLDKNKFNTVKDKYIRARKADVKNERIPNNYK